MSTLARLLLLYCLGTFTSAGAATFEWRFVDGAGEGFNDATPIPAEQRGNNPGTTFGEARRQMLMEAGRIWGPLLVSNVPIIVQVSFDAQDCDATTGTLASAGARTFFRDFIDGPSPDTFFASALADSLAGTNLMLQTANQNDPDIRATFNLSVDTDPACLNGAGFYYGFDNQPPTTASGRRRIDALVVALHELAHGFGFVSEIDTDTGVGFNDGRFSSFVLQIFDEQLGRAWPMLSPAERITSAVGNAGLTWNGTNVNTTFVPLAPGVTAQGRLRLFAPNPVSDGSSVSHWDRSATPNLLMEPNISRDLTRMVDVTVCALRDIGWLTTRCPDMAVARGATPVATSQSITVMEDTPAFITLMATDAENDPLVYGISTLPTRGTLSGSTAMRTYTPTANATGADSFSFTASDGGTSSAPATVTIAIIPVNDPPTASDLLIGANSGQASPIPLLGSDVDGDALTFEIVTNPTNGTLSGTGGTRSYLSNNRFAGTDTFTYRVRDASTVSTTATVTINVTATVDSTPTPGGRGGGGGAMNEWLLLALALLAMAAHRTRAQRAARV